MGVALAGIGDTVLKKPVAGPLHLKVESLCNLGIKKIIPAESATDKHFLKLKLLTRPANKIPVIS